jgi:hypothetical protein
MILRHGNGSKQKGGAAVRAPLGIRTDGENRIAENLWIFGQKNRRM